MSDFDIEIPEVTKATKQDIIAQNLVVGKRIGEPTLGRMPGSEDQFPILDVQIMKGDFAGQTFRYGIVTQAVYDKIEQTARKDKEGNIYLLVPQPNIQKKVNWLNVYVLPEDVDKYYKND
jgi:hypothetical protein